MRTLLIVSATTIPPPIKHIGNRLHYKRTQKYWLLIGYILITFWICVNILPEYFLLNPLTNIGVDYILSIVV